MGMSVNTNIGAMAALQSLNQTNKGLSTTQSRINTGLAVGSTKDDSAKFTIAQKLRGDIGSLNAVASSLNNAKSVTDVAVSGTEQISDLLNQMKAKATEASDYGLDEGSRTAIGADLQALKEQISTVIKSSSFNGVNLLKASGGNITALQSISDSTALTVENQGLDGFVFDDAGTVTTPSTAPTQAAPGTAGVAGTAAVAGAGGGLGSDDAAGKIDLSGAGGADKAVQMIADIENVAKTVTNSLRSLGAASRKVDGQLAFTSKLTDTIEGGIGNLVDADLAKESAKLQALQVKQQLGLQALSIANQAPQSIMSLFR